MLAAVPPVIFPMVRTAESRGAIVLEIMVCNSVRMYADVMTGSMLLWGVCAVSAFSADRELYCVRGSHKGAAADADGSRRNVRPAMKTDSEIRVIIFKNAGINNHLRSA